MKKITSLLLVLSMVFSVSHVVRAHGGVEHESDVEAVAHTELTDTQMRTLIALLQKLVVLLTAQNEARNSAVTTPVPGPEIVAPVEDEMEIHHEEHGTPVTVRQEDAVTTEKLVIEVEAHNGNTHVHVRYVEKPEVMFFIAVPITDKDEVIRETAHATGLSEEEVRGAVVYLGE